MLDDEKHNMDKVILRIKILTLLVKDFLINECAMPQHLIDLLVVDTTWSADQAEWKTVFMWFADIDSISLIYCHADVL